MNTKSRKPKHAPLVSSVSIEWTRADPAELAKFDPASKVCTMNCGPSGLDPRSRAERMFLCDDCDRAAPPRLLVDLTALLPSLAKVKAAEAELGASDAEWQALGKSEQLRQVDAYLARDSVSRAIVEESTREIMAALAVAVTVTKLKEPAHYE
jgi:hypothetical protein